jgi:hypothetical protein
MPRAWRGLLGGDNLAEVLRNQALAREAEHVARRPHLAAKIAARRRKRRKAKK